MPRELVHVARSERRVLSISGSPPPPPYHRRFLRFAFKCMAYQYKVLSLASRTFTRCMDAALSPLRQMGIHILNYLDGCQVTGGFNITQDPPPQPLRLPGAQGQLCKDHTVTQPTSFVLRHSYRLSAKDSNCLSGVSHDKSVPRGFLQGRYRPSAQSFPYGSGFAGTSVGSASHSTHLVLAEAEGSIRSLASRMPPRNGDSGLCISSGPLEGPLLAKARHDPIHGAQKEGCHDRRFQQVLESAVRGQNDLQPLVRIGVGPAYQLPRNVNSVSGLSILPARHSGTPCASTLRQQVCDIIHKSTGRPCLDATLHAGERPSCVGSEQSALTEGDACAGQNEPRSRHVVNEQCLFRGIDAPPAHSSENLGSL